MTCETCRWFDAGNHDRPLYDWRCVVRSPRVTANSGVQFTIWPDVMKSERCGEWTAKEPA